MNTQRLMMLAMMVLALLGCSGGGVTTHDETAGAAGVSGDAGAAGMGEAGSAGASGEAGAAGDPGGAGEAGTAGAGEAGAAGSAGHAGGFGTTDPLEPCRVLFTDGQMEWISTEVVSRVTLDIDEWCTVELVIADHAACPYHNIMRICESA